MANGPDSRITAEYLRELEAEVRATRECLEKVPMEQADWKPHERSMELGYMAQLIADMPRWIRYAIDEGVVDFETYEPFQGKTTEEVLKHFDAEVELTEKVLGELADNRLDDTFRLQRGEQKLMESTLRETISSTINHLVHHRGQLSVYLRLLGQPVPSIYGPSADTGGFETL